MKARRNVEGKVEERAEEGLVEGSIREEEDQ